MRWIWNVLQFVLTVFGFAALGKLLPVSVLDIYACVAHICLSVCLTLWIIELTQDYWFKSRVGVEGRAVLITGCDSGFGNALVKRLDKIGFKVYACCFDPASEGAVQLKDSCSEHLRVIALDVTKEESVQKAKDFVAKDLDESELWAIVNNAGVLRGFHTELCSMSDFEDCMQVNALGLVRVTKAFLPFIRKSRGRVINVCSLAGRLSCSYFAAYNMSKFAAVSFTEVLRCEMREFGVRVVSVEPEFFGTPMSSFAYLEKIVDVSLKSVDDDTKDAYGTKYINKAKNIFYMPFLTSSSNIDLVLDAMQAGICLKYPADVYKPCRNAFSRLIFFAGERCPRMIVDMILNIAFLAMGLPKPR